MASSYARLISKLKALQRKADRMRKSRAAAIGRVFALIQKHAISVAELGGKRRGRPPGSGGKRGRPKRRGKVAPKYKGPSGVTWSGRGLTPIWLREAIKKGKKKEDFLIKRRRNPIA